MKLRAWGAMVAALGAAIGATAACGSSGSGAGGGAAASSSSSSIGAECGMRLKKQECFSCCEQDFLMENAVLIADLVQTCACAPPDGGVAPPCAADQSCQMECTDMVIKDPCIMCINANAITVMPQDPCVAAGYKICEADPACAPLLACAFTFCKQAS